MNFRFNWDALGIATSVACAIHCAILPLLLTSLPVFGINIIENVMLEYGMIFIAFAIGMYSLWHGYRKHHHSYLPAIVFCVGIILLIAKQIWHNYQLWLLPLPLFLSFRPILSTIAPAAYMTMPTQMIAIIKSGRTKSAGALCF
ncbi:MerC domain-containing protein [Paraflavitalea speifideaquila]|uniref:MerC domain-containing protein n=1 Tax=Paraflavitalea speifideaquila TaxID=3076558 RepID=UPI0028F1111C|nr:MerC domain-containing protein [Paraflavitalea speifideiaquila]